MFEHPKWPNTDLSSSPLSLFYVLDCEGITWGVPKTNQGLQTKTIKTQKHRVSDRFPRALALGLGHSL